MKRSGVFAVLLLLSGLAAAQEPGPAAPQPAAGTTQEQPKKAEKKPSKLKKILKRAAPNCANVGGTGTCWSESEREKEAKEKEQQEREQNAQQAPGQIPRSQPAPRSSPETTPVGESSSRDNQIDLSPPPGDDVNHEGAAMSDVGEFHAWDPHKAAKDVEVGDFYFKDKNYRAAESRYSEALQWKPNDAEATFKLGQAQEKLGKKEDAVKNYEAYLKILPGGEFASEAKKAIDRLQSGRLKAKQ